MSVSPVSHLSEHESWVVKLCIFHKVIDVLLIKMSLSHLFDRSSKAEKKVSLFCISSDPTSVCQSLGVSFNPRFWDMTQPASFRGFGLELANRNRVFIHASPIFKAEWGGEVKQNTLYVEQETTQEFEGVMTCWEKTWQYIRYLEWYPLFVSADVLSPTQNSFQQSADYSSKATSF